MNASVGPVVEAPGVAALRETLQKQRTAFLAAKPRSYDERIADLDAIGRWVEDEKHAIQKAIDGDFGSRSEVETRFTEVAMLVGSIHNAKSQLGRWMRPRRRRVDLKSFALAKNRVVPQPIGVVGVMSPWNFPLLLTLNPLVSIFAAGNAAMVKPSDNSRRFAEVLAKTSSRYFPAEKLVVFDDDGTLGPVFSTLPFDHLVFTGSTRVGRLVMENAARNLTPVTLELGGKSPAVVAPDYSLQTAAERIVWGKMTNAGQICVAPDYLFVPKGKAEAFVEIARKLVAKRYPDLASRDYTSIVADRFYTRLEGLVEDARAHGARIEPLSAGPSPERASRKFAPVAILAPSDDMKVMKEEIFGPILPILEYGDPQEVVDYINARERPLALYPFSHDAAFKRLFVERVMSGGVSINDTLLHVGQADMPFGGVGASGIGHYQGLEGFEAFSKLRPIFQQGPMTPVQWMFQPPYGAFAKRVLEMVIRMNR
jgi:coniferyl-aldehyde dehydrogenase